MNLVFDKVLCAITNEFIKVGSIPVESSRWYDYKLNLLDQEIPKRIVIPLINHPHSDKENGQSEIHYHVDTRYSNYQDKYPEYYFSNSFDIRPVVGKYELQELELQRYFEYFGLPTNVELIKKSKLKHKCIHKGKCPHRGFDLSNVKAINGVITCPLHSLKFEESTKNLITHGN